MKLELNGDILIKVVECEDDDYSFNIKLYAKSGPFVFFDHLELENYETGLSIDSERKTYLAVMKSILEYFATGKFPESKWNERNFIEYVLPYLEDLRENIILKHRANKK